MFTLLINRYQKLKVTFVSLTLNIFMVLSHSNSACAVPLPALGSEPGSISLYDEYAIGKKVFVRIKLSQSYFDHPELEDFIMDRISPILIDQSFVEEHKYSDFQAANKITLFFLDDASLNAFALPGNFIGINKGLISSVMITVNF